MVADNNGWDEYKKLILKEIKDLSDKTSRLEKRMDTQMELISTIREDIAGLKVKSGIWGFIGGGIPSLVAVITILLYT